MKKTITTLIIMLIVFNINAQSRKEFFKSPKGMFLDFLRFTYTFCVFRW